MKAFSKDFCRDFSRNKGRFISVFFIVLLGAAFFSGIRSAKTDMIASADKYYKENKLMDIKIQGTLGITEDDIQDIKGIDGVTVAEGGYYIEAICKKGSKQEELKLIGRPKDVNLCILTDGRYPKNDKECLADYKFLNNTGYKVGDTITLESGTTESIYNKIKYNKYKIVGVCALPYYMDVYRENGTIGDGALESFLVVDPKVFKVDVYSELAVSIEKSSKYSAYDEEYKDIVNGYVTKINGLAEMACQRRYDFVNSEAQKEITKAEDKIKDAEDKLQDAKDEISSGEKEIAKASNTINSKEKELKKAKLTIKDKETELKKAKSTIKTKTKELNQGIATIKTKEKELKIAKVSIADKEKLLSSAKALISSKEKELNSGKAAYEEAVLKLDAGKKEYEAGITQYNTKKDEYEAAKVAYETVKSSLTESEREIKEAELAVWEEGLTQAKEKLDISEVELKSIEKQLESNKEELLKGETEIIKKKGEISDAEKQLASAKSQVSNAEKEISKAKNKIIIGKSEIKKGNSKITSGEKEISKAKIKIKKGESALEEGKKELESNKEKLQEAKDKFKKEETKALKEINSGKKEIKKAKKELAKIKVPKWYVTTRENIKSCKSYGLDAERVNNLGDVFPLIFFMVAALVSLTAMTRMVEEQRQQIGILKALGYGRRTILMKYLCYALVPTLSGSIIGVLIGEIVLPLIIIVAYNMLYTGLTEIELLYNMEQGGTAIIVCVLCTCLATIFACYKATRTKTAELMRPKAPKLGKRVVLERLFIWRYLNFTAKSTCRNIFRYKKRLIMTVIGVGGCMGLILVALGLNDSILTIAKEQFGRIFTYDATIYLDEENSEKEIDKLYSTTSKYDGVLDVLEVQYNAVMISKGEEETDSTLVIPKDNKKIEKYVLFNDRKTHEKYKLPKEGAVLTEKTAEELKVKVGDSVKVRISKNDSVNVKVKYIMENYLENNIYISKEYYKKIYKEDIKINQFLVKMDNATDKLEKDFGKVMINDKAVVGIWFMSDSRESVDNMLDSLIAVVYVLLISAGLLAIIVLYNLNNINIAERHRELATLKVLGFYDSEVSQYVFRENVFLTLLGIIAGLFIGTYLHHFVIKSIAMEGIMFGQRISLFSYVVGGIITVVFATVVNIVMNKNLKNIDMIESLKSVE